MFKVITNDKLYQVIADNLESKYIEADSFGRAADIFLEWNRLKAGGLSIKSIHFLGLITKAVLDKKD